MQVNPQPDASNSSRAEADDWAPRKMCFTVEPVHAPQELSVRIDILLGKVSLQICKNTISGDVNVAEFHLQKWKDASWGRLAGQAKWRLARDRSSPELIREEPFSTRISNPIVRMTVEETNGPHDVVTLSGCPPHNLSMANFEERQALKTVWNIDRPPQSYNSFCFCHAARSAPEKST